MPVSESPRERDPVSEHDLACWAYVPPDHDLSRGDSEELLNIAQYLAARSR